MEEQFYNMCLMKLSLKYAANRNYLCLSKATKIELQQTTYDFSSLDFQRKNFLANAK